jgi:hypothetical protein
MRKHYFAPKEQPPRKLSGKKDRFESLISEELSGLVTRHTAGASGSITHDGP